MAVDGVKWILDDMVLEDMARKVSPHDLSTWSNNELVVADATARAATQDDSGRRQSMLEARSEISGTEVISSFTVTVGSPAGRILYNHLRTSTSRPTTANLAEHESIAWAMADPAGEDSIFVTRDKLAAMLALAELGRGRVCHPYEFFEYLFNRGYLTEQQFGDLVDLTRKADQSIPTPWRHHNNRS